ncbi:MAG: gamma-butyrobetaine hydroxylase-like domain-containing protein [Pseudomonadales bacterium]
MIPTDVKLRQVSGILELYYEDGMQFNLPAEYLRVYSPSAEVQGHSKEQAVLQHGKKMVKIADLIPQGHYALRIVFSDGHDSGIYSWEYLHDLGARQDQLWAEYLAQLEKAGKSREPQFIAVSQ